MASEDDVPAADGAPKMQLITSDGSFQTHELEDFVSRTRMASSSAYQVVAIMGPQSSGKSTLVNHVFGTDFVMMDAMTGRHQTTMGVWLSRAPKLEDDLTLVMDLEGSDGRERGEDDTNFERQSALFALAVADVLIVNVWSIEIGREHGSGKPLLRTIFQVNLKLFAPDPNRKRTVLLFVIRDKTKTPLPKLVEVMEDDLGKMWDTIAKPSQYEGSKLRDFFDVQYAAMSHFEEKYEDFLVDAALLRRRFTPDDEHTLVRPTEHLPGAAFALSAQKIWEAIRSQKDLNLPAHKVMVANIRCAEIAADQLAGFVADQAWQELEQEARAGGGGVVRGFNARLSGLLDSCLQGYEADAMYFDPRVRNEKLEGLRAKLWEAVAPAVADQVSALHAQHLATALKELQLATGGSADASAPAGHAAPGSAPKEGGGQQGQAPVPFAAAARAVQASAGTAFRRGFQQDLLLEGAAGTECNMHAAAARFDEDLGARVAALRAERVAEALTRVQRPLASALSGPSISLLDSCTTGVWRRLHAAARSAAATSERALLQELEGYELGPQEQAQLSEQLAHMARTRMENHVREAALTRISRMKDRFTEVFTLDEQKTPRMWRASDNIPALAHDARMAAANVLAQLAVLRPPPGAPRAASAATAAAAPAAPGAGADGGGGVGAAGPDGVETAVVALARADMEGDSASSSSALDILSADAWPGVVEQDVLLQPHDIRTTWREFMSASNVQVQQALSAQQTASLAGSRPPPFWAILAILFLGWNEFMALMYNPLLLVLGLVLFLFGRTLYAELDVDAEMARGSLPGALALMAKLRPATRTVVQRVWASTLQLAGQLPQELQQAKRFVSESELSAAMSSNQQAPAPQPQPQRQQREQETRKWNSGAGGEAGGRGEVSGLGLGAQQQSSGSGLRRRGGGDVGHGEDS